MRLIQTFIIAITVLLLSSGCFFDDRQNPFDPLSAEYICNDPEPKGDEWTVMVYSDADNNLEASLMADIQEMKLGFVDGQGINLVVMIDRHANDLSIGYSGDSWILGENFSDTRLYRITHNNARQLCGLEFFPGSRAFSSYEANMGDARTSVSYTHLTLPTKRIV